MTKTLLPIPVPAIFSKFLEKLLVLLRHLPCIHTLPLRLGIIVVEIARVGRVRQLRHNGALHAPVVQGVPVDAAEERVGLNALRAAGDVTQAVGGVDGAETGDEVACLGGHALGVGDFAVDDSGRVSVDEERWNRG